MSDVKWYKMPSCMSLTQKNCQCTKKVHSTSQYYCKTHIQQEIDNEQIYGIRTFTTDEQGRLRSRCAWKLTLQRAITTANNNIVAVVPEFSYCEHDAEPNNALCSQHLEHQVATKLREQALKDRRKEIKDTIRELFDRTPRPSMIQVIDELYGQYLIHPTDILRSKHKEIIWGYATLLRRADPDYDLVIHLSYFAWSYRRNREGVNPLTRLQTTRTALARLVQDRENVHTSFVTTQTNANMKRMMDIKVDPYQNTMIEIMSNWFRLYPNIIFNDFVPIMNDILNWNAKSLCKEDNDWLYHRLLTRLVTYINHSQYKDELYKRLYEECVDANGKCCEGHLSRLCNVLVGFDEEMISEPEISLNELIQMKLGAISQADLTTEQKIEQANTFFNEHNVPQQDRQVWLDAF